VATKNTQSKKIRQVALEGRLFSNSEVTKLIRLDREWCWLRWGKPFITDEAHVSYKGKQARSVSRTQ
jgi:hypothetical protein